MLNGANRDLESGYASSLQEGYLICATSRRLNFVAKQIIHELPYADDCAVEAHSQEDIQMITWSLIDLSNQQLIMDWQ